MVMKLDKLEQVFGIIQTYQPISVDGIASQMGMGRSSMYPYLEELMKKRRIRSRKVRTRLKGQPPKTYEVVE